MTARRRQVCSPRPSTAEAAYARGGDRVRQGRDRAAGGDDLAGRRQAEDRGQHRPAASSTWTELGHRPARRCCRSPAPRAVTADADDVEADDHRRRPGRAGHQGAGLHVHHVLHRRARSSSRSQNIVHRRQGGRRRDRQARRDVLAQRAHRRARLRRRATRTRRSSWTASSSPGVGGGVVAVHHDAVQRRLLRGPGGRRAQAALVLLLPVPGGHRVDDLLPDAGPEVQATPRRTACSSTRRTPSDSVTVSMWSTKVLRQRQDRVEPRSATSPSRRRSRSRPAPSASLPDGIQGFTQDAWRIFRKDGKEIKREKFTWRYDAEPRFICGTPENRLKEPTEAR